MKTDVIRTGVGSMRYMAPPALRGGLHVKAADGTPMANALLTVAHALGLDDLKTLGDSTGPMDLNAATDTTVAQA